MATEHPFRSFEIEGKWLGTTVTRARPSIFTGAILDYAFFCPTCCNIWARSWVYGNKWIAWHVPCKKCFALDTYYNPFRIPASILSPFTGSSAREPLRTEDLPPALLEHEFIAYVNHYLKTGEVSW